VVHICFDAYVLTQASSTSDCISNSAPGGAACRGGQHDGRGQSDSSVGAPHGVSRTGHFGSFDPAGWKQGRRRALLKLEAALKDGSNSRTDTILDSTNAQSTASGNGLCRERLILVDDTMHLKSMRRQVRRLAAQHAAAFQIVHLHCSAAIAGCRNSARPTLTRVPSEVFLRLVKAMETPTAAEGALLTCDEATLERPGAPAAVLQSMLAAWGAPEHPPQQPPGPDPFQAAADRAATAASQVQSLDVASRRVVSHALSNCPPDSSAADKADLAMRLNALRRQLVEECRACTVGGLRDCTTPVTQCIRELQDQAEYMLDDLAVTCSLARLRV